MSHDISLILPYYENPGMLQKHQEYWASYPTELRRRLHVLVIDDGSPTKPALTVFKDVLGLGSYRLYRITIDVRWNWLACRNIGAKEMETDWGLFTDIDHLLPLRTFANLVSGSHDENCVYRFSRVDYPDLTPYKPHPNSWFLARRQYWKIGGNDERFSGYYPTDFDFMDRAKAASKEIVLLDDPLIRVPREEVPDASTTTLQRMTEFDTRMVKQIWRERTAVVGWTPQHFKVPWERLR